MADSLRREFRAFESMQQELLRKHRGKYGLIHDARVCGVFADAGAANSEGIRRYGEDGVFLVAMVSPRRQPAWKRTAVGDMLLVS